MWSLAWLQMGHCAPFSWLGRTKKGYVNHIISISIKGSFTLTQLTFLFDREVRQFDISSPIQALQYATFLLRLKRQADQDKAELTDRILGYYRTNKLTQSPRPWHKAAQIAEFKEFHTATKAMLPVQDVQVENEPLREGQATAAPKQGTIIMPS